MKNSSERDHSQVQIFPLVAFQDNYIWVITRGKKVVVVDPGDAHPVLEYLAQTQSELIAILITHHHGDHVGGVRDLLEKTASDSQGLFVYGPEFENIDGCNVPLKGGEKIEFPTLGIDFQVLAVPGHTRGHLAYYGKAEKGEENSDENGDENGALFCGDTLFGAGCGRLFEGTPAQMHDSLMDLAKLPGQTQCFCAHEYTQSNLRFALTVEPDNSEIQERVKVVAIARDAGQATVPFTLAGELATNPFLRLQNPAVQASAARYLGRKPANSIETFAVIRKWKDEFR